MSKVEPLVNNGEHIYYKNIAKNILRQNKIEETKKNDEDNFTMEFNFQPHFLKTENDNYSNVKSRIYRESTPQNKSKNENLATNLDKKLKNVELKGDDEIKKMTERLYSETKKFKENKEKLSKNLIKDECPFKPTINVPGKADPKFFMMRLEKWNKKIEEKNKENIEKKNNLGVNHGRSKLFQPVVKDPIAKKMKRENEVHIDLYNKGLEHLNYRKSIMTTDTREDLAKIESEKKERIKNLKEERDRFKKEKQEKMEKEINERTLKAKVEKENLDKIIKEKTEQIFNAKIIKEKTEQIFNEIDKKEKKAAEMLEKKNAKKKEIKNEEKKETKNINKENKDIRLKSANPNLVKNEKDNKEKNQMKENPKKEEKKIPKVSQKEKENTDIKKPHSSKQKANVKVEKPVNKKEEPSKKIEKIERNKSQPQKSKNKNDSAQKEKETKTITASKEEKESNLVKIKKVDNKNDNTYANKLKSAKNNIKNLLNNKNEIIGEIEFNNMKNNKKSNINHKNTTEYNVVSVGSKAGKIKKEKTSKK